jgi:large subunit ribosomal protein L4
MKRLALRSALSARAAEEAIKVIDSFEWSVPRTSDAAALLTALGIDGKALIVLTTLDDTAGLAFRNLPQVVIAEPGHITAYDVMWATQVLFTSQTVNAVGGAGAYDISRSDFVKEESDFVREGDTR